MGSLSLNADLIAMKGLYQSHIKENLKIYSTSYSVPCPISRFKDILSRSVHFEKQSRIRTQKRYHTSFRGVYFRTYAARTP